MKAFADEVVPWEASAIFESIRRVSLERPGENAIDAPSPGPGEHLEDFHNGFSGGIEDFRQSLENRLRRLDKEIGERLDTLVRDAYVSFLTPEPFG